MWPFDDDENELAPAPPPVTPAPQGPPVSAAPDPVVRQYLIDKYKMAADDKDVRSAEDEQRKMAGYAAMLEGIGRMATAGSVARGGPGIDSSNFKVMRDVAQQKVDAARRQRADRMQAFEAEDRLGRTAVERERSDQEHARKEATHASLADPASPETQQRRQLAATFTGKRPEDFAHMSGAQLDRLLPQMETLYKIDQARQERGAAAAERAQARADAAADRQLRRDELLKEREEKRVDAGVEKLGDKIQPLQEMGRALAEIEDTLGFPLDSYDEKSGTVPGRGEVDVPGVSLPLVGRVSAYDGDARMLNAKVSKVFNTTLRDRSGAAVTTPEMERLKNEFASGKFNSEREMIGALKAYRAEVAKALGDTKARFRPEAVETYRDRGGTVDMPTGGKKPAAPPGEERVINGVRFRKVEGGWQKVKAQ